MEYIGLIIVCLFGGVLQTLIGFGCAIVMMAFLPYFLSPLPQVSGLTSVVCFFCSLMLVVKYRRPVKLRKILPVFIVYMLIMPISNKISLTVQENKLRLLLGITLTLMSVYYIFFSERKFKLSGNLPTAAGVGAISGVLSGMFTIGGPPVVIYTMAISKDKEEYLGMIQFYFTICNLFSSIVKTCTGVITLDNIGWIGAALVAVMIGNTIGAHFQNRMNWNVLRKWVYVLIAYVGISNIVRGIK